MADMVCHIWHPILPWQIEPKHPSHTHCRVKINSLHGIPKVLLFHHCSLYAIHHSCLLFFWNHVV